MPGEEFLTQGLQGMTGNVSNLIGGTIQGITGFFQKKKGNKILKDNPRPTYAIPTEVLANQEAAKQMADEGLASQQYSNAQKNIQRQQVAALANAQDRKLGGALIGGIQQKSNDAMGDLDVADAQARRQNQLNLQNVNNQVASYRDKAFDWNQRQKYIQNYNYGMGLVGQGNANLYGGIDKLASGLIGGGASGLNASKGGSPSFTGLSGGGGYTPQLADTSGGVPSPAGQFGNYIDPNSAPYLIGG